MEKPRYYRIKLYGGYVLFFIFVFSSQAVDGFYQKTAVFAFFIVVSIGLNKTMNVKEATEYFNYETKQKRAKMQKVQESSSVNKNIERYLEDQRIKKLNAKWWQFWV